MDDIMNSHFKKEYGEAEVKKLEQQVDRLESIKEALAEYKADEDLLSPPERGYLEDVEYLLQRLERYEKVLSKIAFGRIEGGYSDVKYYARVALNDEIT